MVFITTFFEGLSIAGLVSFMDSAGQIEIKQSFHQKSVQVVLDQWFSIGFVSY